MRKLRKLLVFTLTIAWLFSGQFQIWHSPLIPPRIKEVKADTTNLMVTSCDDDDVNSPTCYTAISADGGTSYAFTKNLHLDAPFQTLNASAVSSATLYYDSWATLSGSWAIYVKDARDGNTICSVDPAPEDVSEVSNSLDCSSVTTTQLSNGIWFQADNNDGAGPQDVNLDYVRFYVDYTPPAAVSITLDTDGTVPFSTVALEATVNSSTDVQTVTVDTGPADLDVRSTAFTEGGNTWALGTSNGPTQVKWEFSEDNSAWTTFAVINTLYALDTNVPQDGSRDLYLRLTMPTTTNSYNQYSSTVTIVASNP